MELTQQQLERYSRHILLSGFGRESQEKLLASKVLLVGMGGLGSPAALYLAAAGVGTMGIVDQDVVEMSNLQRQIIHSELSLGNPKTQSASRRLKSLNPDVDVIAHETRLTSANAMEILGGYDVIIDGSDNFPTRYLTNDACCFLGKPNVYGAVQGFEGQVSVFAPPSGPCYRCLFAEPPPPGSVPSCAEAGVLGILPGVIGLLQATEAIKLLTGKGQSLAGRLLIYDALAMEFRTIRVQRNPACPLCGSNPTIKSLIDYEGFCSGGAAAKTAAPPYREISPEELRARLDSGVPFTLIDVRTPDEYAQNSIEGSRLIPLGELPRRVGELQVSKDQDVIIHCKMGARSARACAILKQFGFERVYNLRGGIDAWLALQRRG
jgi:sulfur-carrier protein adenylyltransferase/sulfurtransferase